jgi:hypothetical protein
MPASTDRRVESHVVGPHRVELEFPDIVHIHYGGDVELAHFFAFNETMLALPPPPLPLYLLRDARNGGFVAAETRAHIANHDTKSRFVAIATYGSSFQTKTVFANMSRAIKVVRQNSIPTEFFDTEDEAREFISMHREAEKAAAR